MPGWGAFGACEIDVNATLTGPSGGTLTGGESDSRTGFGDLYPMASLKWNRGVHNFRSTRWPACRWFLRHGPPREHRHQHWSLDAGGGYTYLDDKKGHEFSAVLGFTYNFENPDTDYKNGIDAHLDWAASQPLSEQFHAGLVGYLYQQLWGDSGSGAVLGDFKSRVSAIGPQTGYFFLVVGRSGTVNFKAITNSTKNRPEGWNVWLTVVIPLGAK